jgi:hypothetical protein
MEPALRAAFADSKIAESRAIFRLVVDVVKGKKNVPQVLKTISKNKHLKNLPGASKSNICRLVIKGKAVVIQGKAAGAAWCDEHDARATSDRAEPVGTCPNVDSRLAAHSRLMPNQSMQKEREDHGRRQNYAEAFNVACQQRYREVNDKRYLAAGTFRPVSCAKIAQAVTARFADAGKYFNKNLTGDIIMKYVREERGSLVGGIMQFIPDKKGPDAKIPAAILTLGTTHMQMTQVSGEGKETVVDVASTIFVGAACIFPRGQAIVASPGTVSTHRPDRCARSVVSVTPLYKQVCTLLLHHYSVSDLSLFCRILCRIAPQQTSCRVGALHLRSTLGARSVS